MLGVGPVDFNLVFLLVGAPAVIFAGISKAGFGSGASFAAASILALVLEPGAALGILLPLLMLMDVSSLRPYWGRWHWQDAKWLILGSVPGVALGAWLYGLADPDHFRLLIGGISIAFVVWSIARARGWVAIAIGRVDTRWGGFAGFLAGFTSFVSHAGGPPMAVYLLRQGLDKTSFQATTVLFFWIVNLLKFIPYATLGIFTPQTILADLILAPFAVLGAYLGVRAHHWVPERAFFLVTYVALLATGAKLIWDGLT